MDEYNMAWCGAFGTTGALLGWYMENWYPAAIYAAITMIFIGLGVYRAYLISQRRQR